MAYINYDPRRSFYFTMAVLFFSSTVLLAMVLAVLAMGGCAVCTSQTTRCYGNMAQVCDSRGHWRTFMDCDTVYDAVFVCQEVPDEGGTAHTCMPDMEVTSDGSI